MEKVISFTDEQKSLIWTTKVEPKSGTEDEARLFVEVCETYGLNPLLGDIVFQKFETKYGPRVNFITTRDGYVKASMRDPNYVQCVSNVVREGDHFEFDTVSGEVAHKIKAQRGPIVGAWAIAEHKTRGKYPIFVDFGEHFMANAASQNGRNQVWDSHPSAMIQKVAEVYALRRQFPLGGIVAEEEIGGIDFESNNLSSYGQEQLPMQPQEKEKQQGNTTAGKKEEKKPRRQQKQEKAETTKTEPQTKQQEVVSEEQKTIAHLFGEDPFENKGETPVVNEPDKEEETPSETVQNETPATEPVSAPSEHQEIQNHTNTEGDEDFEQVKVIKIVLGKSPSGIPFAKIAGKRNGANSPSLIIAQGENKVELLDFVEEGSNCLMKVKSENGYDFLEDLKIA